MDIWKKYKSPLGYETGDNQRDSYGVDHSQFSLRDEIEYQTARAERENRLIQNYNNQGITENYPQVGTNFWGNPENNYGFGSSNISDAISHHPAMHTAPMPIEQTSSLSEINAFNDSYGGYSGVGNTTFEEQPISKANSSAGFQAPKTSMSDVFLEGVKGFGEGVLGGTERFVNGMTGGMYGQIIDEDMNNAYTNHQNYLQNLAIQAGLGSQYDWNKHFLDIDAALMNYYLIKR